MTLKTEMLVQDFNRPLVARSPLAVNVEALNAIEEFSISGRGILPVNCNLSAEIQTRIRLASAPYGRLAFHNRNLTISTKTNVYNLHFAVTRPL